MKIPAKPIQPVHGVAPADELLLATSPPFALQGLGVELEVKRRARPGVDHGGTAAVIIPSG
jgi:hypothetical protein